MQGGDYETEAESCGELVGFGPPTFALQTGVTLIMREATDVGQLRLVCSCGNPRWFKRIEMSCLIYRRTS